MLQWPKAARAQLCSGGETDLVILSIRFPMDFMKLPDPFYYWQAALKRASQHRQGWKHKTNKSQALSSPSMALLMILWQSCQKCQKPFSKRVASSKEVRESQINLELPDHLGFAFLLQSRQSFSSQFVSFQTVELNPVILQWKCDEPTLLAGAGLHAKVESHSFLTI